MMRFVDIREKCLEIIRRRREPIFCFFGIDGLVKTFRPFPDKRKGNNEGLLGRMIPKENIMIMEANQN